MADAQDQVLSTSSSSSLKPGGNIRKRRRAIAFVDDKSARQVTYSKRRPGLFKKAAEACLLTGCSVAIVGFSPAGRPFSFSSTNDFLDSFLAGDTDVSAYAAALPPSEEIMELASEVAELERRIAAKKSAARSVGALSAAERQVEAALLAVLARLDELKNFGRPSGQQGASSSC